MKGTVFVEDRVVAGHGRRSDAMRIGEPDHVVRDHRAHAGAGARQPPVLDVAFGELPARRH